MSFIGQEFEFTVNGKNYKVCRLDANALDSFLAYADKVLPHPLVAIAEHFDKFPLEIQKIMITHAQEKAERKRAISDPEVQSLMQSPEGSLEIVRTMFRKYHPELTKDDIWKLYFDALAEHGSDFWQNQVIAKASGELPPDIKKN